ncbi:NAD(P)-dependent dehydrogenase (short-subunit alcohol dehydrogenase family) [Pseudomonas baetica]|nr:NAD(P)-dependent dehydrogenase (short-subunit alcohol dehydrogenase family) [Pseudomonas baetica]
MTRRTFLITGASKGIGRALFVDGGASVGKAAF